MLIGELSTCQYKLNNLMLGFDIVKDLTGNDQRTERRDAAENRQRILDVAVRLFEEHGVEEVSMNQIAIEAQIGPGTLYRRYRSKSELCLDLIKDNVVMLFEDIELYLKQQEAEPPGQRLKGTLNLFIQFREKKLQLLAGIEDTGSHNRPQKKTPGPIYEQLHEILVKLFDEMIFAEQPQPDSVFRADMLLTGLRNESYLFQRNVRGCSPDQILEQLCLTFIPLTP